MGLKLAIAAGAAVLSVPGAVLIAVATVTAPTASLTACSTSTPTSEQTPATAVSGGTRGGVGTGLRLGALPTVHAATGTPYVGKVRMAVANLPTTHHGAGSLPTVPGSLRSMTRRHPDFIALNEITAAGARFLSAHAPGYDAYKDPVSATRHGNSRNSLENAVMWDARRWSLVDAGRFEYVADDLVVFKGRPVDWNRYAIWTVLRNHGTGRQIVVIATHNMTNPQKQRRTHGDYAWPSRIAQYAAGMRLLRQLITRLSVYGPVLLAGDMNVHPSQGGWSAPDQLARAGYSFAYDRSVIYQFFPRTARLLGTSLVPVSSDHPHALVTTLVLRSTAESVAPAKAGSGNVPDSLTATDTNSRTVTLDRRQLARAATIIAVGRSEGVPARGQLIALMTALTESSLRVLSNVSAYPESGSIPNDGNSGDHDSLGLFQQRPAAGWGTVQNLMDPVWSSRAFYGGPSGPNHGSPRGLLDLDGWQTMDPGAAAQAVQGSGYPGRYAVNQSVAAKILAALSGVSLSSDLGCAQPTGAVPADLPPGLPGALIATAAKEIGTPYVWGGGNFDGPTDGGFDCSGLVLYAVYQASGGRIRLPHYTGDQIHLGQPIAWADKQPGDLIFFSYPGAIGPHHVAIYVGGDKILQAPRTGEAVRYGRIDEFSGQTMTVRRQG
ncbi:NlpC/P60 family protein [Nocardioides cheoyonin]|uniref:NlpC/P60 family protein n=1 Tax=Nocardioides cheoyonin TaxID=3156615 RepID=UPI0032B5840A